eukprot:6210377-Pyramimonas_sp.AAC.2
MPNKSAHDYCQTVYTSCARRKPFVSLTTIAPTKRLLLLQTQNDAPGRTSIGSTSKASSRVE